MVLKSKAVDRIFAGGGFDLHLPFPSGTLSFLFSSPPLPFPFPFLSSPGHDATVYRKCVSGVEWKKVKKPSVSY